MAQNGTYPSTDQAVYEEYARKWADQPQDADGWIKRAQDVASVLEKDASARERENKSPRAEVALLKHSGLTKVLGPKKYGGGDQPWSVGYKTIREVAKADGSIGMLLGYHLLWSTTANVVGSSEQADRLQKLILSNNYFIGGAVNPRDNDLKITDSGDKITFNGRKHFNTGGVVSDLTVLEGVLEGTEDHIFALVPTVQPGIKFAHNWDNVGLRLTESGGVSIEGVAAPWEDALGWDVKTKRPDPAVLGIPFASLLLPTIQLVFSNFYLGIALGALQYASKYTASSTRAWPFGGDNKEKATDEFYILSTYQYAVKTPGAVQAHWFDPTLLSGYRRMSPPKGNFLAHLRAAEALADKAGLAADSVYTKYPANKADVTARERGEFAEWVASIKVVATDTGLRVTSGLFEVTGAKSTATKVGLDRFWRDVRTHTLHDPVSYKNRELGRYQLLDEVPEPTWYT